MKYRVMMTVAASTVFVVGGAFAPVAADAHQRSTTVVHRGESIQAALDAATPGATVFVTRGTYYENLTITKPVTLRGVGDVVLRPNVVIADNLCTEDTDGSPDGLPNNTGICILGELAAPTDGSDIPTVTAPVLDVTIDNLSISNFHGQGILAFGTDHLVVKNVSTDHNGDTGLFFEAADHTRIIDSTVTDTGHFAVRVADSHDVVASGNTIRGGQAGIVGIEVSGGRIAENFVTDTCLGIGLLDDPEPGDTGNIAISENVVTGNSRFCPAEPDGPSISGLGVALFGTIGVRVSENRITHNVGQADPATGARADLSGAAVLVMDATDFSGGGIATGNAVTHNVITRNAPLDVADVSTGVNVINHNRCATSSPASICSH